ncbi:hypothetical protein MMC06_005619 [Schaereria dolodes]|nr:hypothetical protein [Schaereria dolodes]
MYKTNIPPAHRFPDPSAYEATSQGLFSVKHLVPAPLRRSRSPPRLRASERAPRLHQIREDAKPVAFHRPLTRRVDNLRQARSVSPVSFLPSLSQDRRPSEPVLPRYQRRPAVREYLTVERMEDFPSSQRPPVQASQSNPDFSTLEPVKTTAPTRKSRRYVPSMVDYLTLEQLEDVWDLQDTYKGTVDVPQKPFSPVRRRPEELVSPISPAVNAAFRHREHPFHNGFAQV